MIAWGAIDRLAEGDGVRVTQHRDDALAVVTLDFRRPASFFQAGQTRNFDQAGLGRGDRQAVQGTRRGAILKAGTKPHVILLAAIPKRGDRQSADQNPQRVRNRADGNAEVAGGLAVDDDLDLGLAQGERGIKVRDAPRLFQFALELLSVFGQPFQLGTGKVDLERLGAAASLERRNIVDADAEVGECLHHLADIVLDVELCVLAVTQLLHTDVERPPRYVPLPFHHAAAGSLADGREDVYRAGKAPDFLLDLLGRSWSCARG